MSSFKPQLNSLLLRPPATSATRAHLPWLPPLPDRPTRRPEDKTTVASHSPRLTNSAVLRAVTAPGATPQQILAVYSRAARQPDFRHDYRTYAALIPAVALRRRLRAAGLLLSRMSRDGLRPGPALLLPLLAACSAAGLPASAISRLLLSSPPPSERSFSALIDALLRAGRLDIARSLLEDSELGFPIRVRHYIGLVRAYCDRGSVELAVELLDFMACKRSVPEVCCYGALIRGLPVDAAFAVVDQMRRAGREPDVVVWNTLVHGCVLAGEVGRAEELVAEMEQRGVPSDTGTYNALISGIIYRGSIEKGINVLNCMLDRGVSPDVITFSTLIGQLGKEGRVLECNAVFGWMMKTWILPDAACYRILFGVYCRNSILGDAAAVLQAMDFDGFLDGGEIWGRMVLQCDEQFREKVLGVWLKSGLMGYLIGNGG